KCAAAEVVTVTPQVGGKIVKIHFTDGQELTAGDPLFTIDRRPFISALDSAKATLAEDRATLQWASLELSRVKGLVEIKAISQSDYDQKQNAVDVANAKVNVSQAAVSLAELNLEYCEIRSPIHGRAGQHLVDIGNVVKENEGAILNIQ